MKLPRSRTGDQDREWKGQAAGVCTVGIIDRRNSKAEGKLEPRWTGGETEVDRKETDSRWGSFSQVLVLALSLHLNFMLPVVTESIDGGPRLFPWKAAKSAAAGISPSCVVHLSLLSTRGSHSTGRCVLCSLDQYWETVTSVSYRRHPQWSPVHVLQCPFKFSTDCSTLSWTFHYLPFT